MKIIGIIPARMASTRFPGKPLADIHGKPMIQVVYERVRESHALDDIIVATDSAEIQHACERFGARVEMTSEDHQNGTQRIIEVCERHPQIEAVINIQGDEPTIHPSTIDGVAKRLGEGAEISTAAIRFSKRKDYLDPHQVKVVLDRNRYALYFSRSPIPFIRPGAGSQDWEAYKHLGIYGYTKDVLMKLKTLESPYIEKSESLEQLRFLYHGYKIAVHIATYASHGVDTPEDLEKVKEHILNSNG